MVRSTRRHLLRLLAAAAGVGPFARWGAAAPAPAEPLRRVRSLLPEAEAARSSRKTYRADATVLFLGLPIYTRSMAGAAVAEAREVRRGDERLLSFLFTAGSLPDRARGLNRLGYFEEAVLERNDSPCHAAYFGFLTSSPEADVGEGRAALQDQPDQALYEVIDGEVLDGWDLALRNDLWMPAELDWQGVRELDRGIRDRVRQGEIAYHEDNRNEAPVSTFLYSVMTTAWGRKQDVELHYTYNSKLYRMNVGSEADPRQGKKFADKGLNVDPEKVTCVEGEMVGLTEPSEAKFKLWMSDCDCPAVPVRIEYKLRGFLRVAFEQDPGQSVPV